MRDLSNKATPQQSKQTSLKCGALQFKVSLIAIHDIFKQGWESLEVENLVANLLGRKTGRFWRNKRLLNLEAMKAITLIERQNIQSLATHL